jgi:hypothetical protein
MAEESSVKGKMLPLVWEEPGTAVFANQAIAQYDGHSVYLTFGQVRPPLILGETEEERHRQIEKVQSVTVLPVVRIAMTPETFRVVAEALQKHLALINKIEKPKE